MTEFRPLSESEMRTLERLFEPEFIGRAKLKQQLAKAKVKEIDSNGSLEFDSSTDIVAPVKDGPILEARYPEGDATDLKDICVNVLLHVKDGKLWMLEIYKDDSSELLKPLAPEKFTVSVREESSL